MAALLSRHCALLSGSRSRRYRNHLYRGRDHGRDRGCGRDRRSSLHRVRGDGRARRVRGRAPVLLRSFADRDNFHVEVQVLAGQHVVAVNHHVVAVNFGDFNRYRALIGVSQETHADLQFVNAHEDVFRYALHRVSS